MSFAHFDIEAQRGSSSDDHVSSDTNPDVQILNNISNKLSDWISNISKFDKLHQQLGTRRDNSTLRSTLERLNKSCNKLSDEINTSLDNLKTTSTATTGANPELLFKQEKLRTQCQEVFKNYQLIQRSYNEKIQSVMINEEYSKNEQAQSQMLLSQSNTTDGTATENTPLLPGRTQQQLIIEEQEQAATRQAELDYHSSVISERESAIENIAKGVQDINRIFKDLNEMVHQQGEQIDTIEDNVMTYATTNQLANRELIKADEYQKKKRKWSCILFVALTVVLVIVLAVIS
ncbi:hypothetical protein CANARDRAFT_176470 [[Candida] arabinofermentans NRRL YB-2248]|uniref:t-SNARE coiled-coil homology domain-containing protein n=1 Tax=[Candida] arabinofermentans NRRL YB-2248 TaxID=983967 RepID=A0A1E4SZY3_9ASCO|nr:hypothetical protein CANARDRAFT_176470 [[Candida] arabinofermentans NRRL YB-2248]